MILDAGHFSAPLADAGLDSAHAERLAAFGNMLLDANSRFNLTGAKNADELLPHLLDALTVAPHVSGHYVDVGSGGGLPAIAVAIVTGAEVTLIESVVKKAAFLRAALAQLNLPGRVVADRAEVAGRDPALRGQFDAGTARAVSTAPTVAELLMPLLRIGGKAILQRGSFEQRERDALNDAALMLGGRVTDEVELEGGRRIVTVLKEHPTPERFPRRAGIPEKRPLCL